MQTPAINTEEIKIDVEPLDHFDQKLTVVLPAHCIKQITDRLAEGNMEQNDKQLAQLLTNICVEESMGRQESPPLWGPALPIGGAPPLPAEGEDYSIEFLIDRMPDLSLPEFSELTIRKPTREIDSAMVEAELAHQCIESGTHTAYDGPLDTTDRFRCSLTITNPKDGTVVASYPNLTGRIPEPDGRLLLDGIFFPGLGEAIRGKSQGDTISCQLPVPSQVMSGALSTDIHQIDVVLGETERTVPAQLEDVVNLYGSPSAEVLRKQVRASLENRFSFEQASFMTEDLFAQLMKDLDYTPPRRIVHKALQDQASSIAKSIQQDGGSAREVEAALEKARPDATKKVLAMLRRRAVNTVLRNRLKIGVNEQHIQARIRQLAALQNKRPEDFRKELIDTDLITSISAQAVEAQITEQALADCKVVEVDADSLEQDG
ncbi:MAG: hypothetical protein CBC35_01660 [Planctomycetes bacterium TMED75]|nr:hypothetical protein [Planctomycetaceae bacterium]OUU96266.1 MAG: hypothetical protein CBC35_01660 [Planctomycetes bacterium TMED75]